MMPKELVVQAQSTFIFHGVAANFALSQIFRVSVAAWQIHF
jgi:hypothetical protein